MIVHFHLLQSHLRESTEVGLDAQLRWVELHSMILYSDQCSEGPITVRLVVALKQDQLDDLLLLPETQEEGHCKEQGVEDLEEEGLEPNHSLWSGGGGWLGDLEKLVNNKIVSTVDID